jgi:phage terminase large subunit
MSEIVNYSKLAHLHPKQIEALEATKKYKYVLYGGAMGGGKSHFLRWAVVYWLLVLAEKYHQKGIRAGLFCEDYGSLNDRHISKIKYEFPKDLGTYNEQRHEFTMHPLYGSSVVAFRNLDDPSKYVSSEFAIIAVDEIGRDPYSMFSILRTRLRWVGIPDVKFICASNPTGEAWVKRYWIDRNFPPEEKETDQFFYIPALPKDNPSLDKSYYQSLESLDEKERKAYLEADWTAFDTEMDAQGFMKLLTDPELQNAIVDKPIHAGEGVLGVDPAAGGDRSAIVYKSETCKEVVFSQKLNDVLQLIPVIAQAIIKFGNVKELVLDRTGVGEGLYRRLKEMESQLRVRIKGISFAESPDEIKWDNHLFDNLKAELYWKEKKWILGGGKLVRHQAWNDWLNIKYQIYGDRKIKIQGKQELRHMGFKSPDVVEAAIITNAASKNLRFNDIYSQGNFTDKTNEIWKQ